MDALPALEFVDRPAAAFAAEVRDAGNRQTGEAELCDTTGMHVDHREILATAACFCVAYAIALLSLFLNAIPSLSRKASA